MKQCPTDNDRSSVRRRIYKLLGLLTITLAVFVLMPVSSSFASSTSVSGIISTSTDWTLSGSPYVIDGQVQVAPNTQLTIEPGVQVIGGKLAVWGTLDAEGSADQMVSFQGVTITPGANVPAQPYEIDLSYCTIDCTSGGSVYTPTGFAIYGTLSLCDSVIVDAPYLYLWYPVADCLIEGNVFTGCGGISVGTDGSVTVTVRNNVFYNSTGPIENWASYALSQTIVEFNTFMLPETGESGIALELPPGYTDAAMTAEDNYWETADATDIASRIYDRSDDLACAGYIPFEPFLTIPDSGTPALITSFTSASGPVGSAVTLSGGDFTDATTVSFNGVAASFTVNSDTQITAIVPAGATSGLITVTTPVGTATSTTTFTVIPLSNVDTLSSLTVSPGTLSPAFTTSTLNYSDSVANSVARITVTPTTTDSQAIYALQVGGATVSNPIPLSVGANLIDVVVTAPNGASETYVVTVTRVAAIIPKPTLTAFTPTSGLVGSSVTLTGTNFTNATVVSFNGHVASFTVRSATQILTHVPSGATSGAIRVTTPDGSATSSSHFTVIVKPTLTLKLSGLISGVLRLGKTFTASGKVTPTTLGGKITLSVQREQSGHWYAVTSVLRSLTTTGTYSWAYKPTRRAVYRIKATIAKTATHTAATTMWLGFTVK